MIVDLGQRKTRRQRRCGERAIGPWDPKADARLVGVSVDHTRGEDHENGNDRSDDPAKWLMNSPEGRHGNPPICQITRLSRPHPTSNCIWGTVESAMPFGN